MVILATPRIAHAAPANTGITTTLTLNTVGGGVLTADPTLPSYAYGQIVTLTATPGPGWLLDHWGGDLTPPNDWCNPTWDYRVIVHVGANGYARTDKPVELDIDF